MVRFGWGCVAIGFLLSARCVLQFLMSYLRDPRAPGFTGNEPGGPSRWSTERSSKWEPVQAKLVAEVAYDHFTAGRFRHGTQFLRWRPDKNPRQCTFAQVVRHGTDVRFLG
jgi:ATP-dependent DNA ligase